MTDEQKQSVVQECGLDWQRGYIPLFDGDPTNRYSVLIECVEIVERERIAVWLEGQRNETPTIGKEFAQALRFCGRSGIFANEVEKARAILSSNEKGNRRPALKQ